MTERHPALNLMVKLRRMRAASGEWIPQASKRERPAQDDVY
ncbi:hypothetical protein GPNCGGLF_LOCUS4013 [Methylorubrum aminovorans]